MEKTKERRGRRETHQQPPTFISSVGEMGAKGSRALGRRACPGVNAIDEIMGIHPPPPRKRGPFGSPPSLEKRRIGNGTGGEKWAFPINCTCTYLGGMRRLGGAHLFMSNRKAFIQTQAAVFREGKLGIYRMYLCNQRRKRECRVA